MSNCYLVSGKGFLTSYIKPRGTRRPEPIFEWSDSVTNAMPIKSQLANKLIEEFNLEAFIWRPFAERVGDRQWVVVQKSNYYFGRNEPIVWEAMSRGKIKDSDIAFLNRKGKKNPLDMGMPKEKAIALAMEKNAEEFDKVTKHIEELNDMNERLMEELDDGNKEI